MARPSPRPPEAAIAGAETNPADEQFEECPDGLVVADASFRIIRMNRRFRELVELPDEWASLDVPARLAVLFAKLEDPAIGFRFVMRVQAAPLEVVTEVFSLKGGKWFEVESRPLGDAAVGRRVVYYRDVTEAIVAKDRLEQLVESTRRDSVALERQAEEMNRLRSEAEYQASHDGLTGLLNRRAWFDRLTASPPDAIAVVDIDYFKHVNDAYGHPAGDAVIAEVASRLAAALPEATVARIGGEEFGVGLNGGIATLRDAIGVASGAIRAPRILLPSGDSIRLTVSVGLAAWRSEDTPGASVARSYEAADAALYEAKRRGRDRLMVAALHAA